MIMPRFRKVIDKDNEIIRIYLDGTTDVIKKIPGNIYDEYGNLVAVKADNLKIINVKGVSIHV